MLYLVAIIVATCVLTVVNIFFAAPYFGIEWWLVILMAVGSVVAEVAIDGLFAFLIRRLPAKWFNHKKKIFIVSKGEKRFYEKIKIRKWKDKVPELGQFTNFSKNKITDPKSNEYLDRYFLEACYGEVIHFSSLFAGFLVIFVLPLRLWYCFGLPVAIANIFFNLPSLFILRYNSTKLRVLYESNARREKLQKAQEVSEPLTEARSEQST